MTRFEEEDAPLSLRSLTITGNQIIPTNNIKEELTLTLPSRWPWKKLPPFKPKGLERDVERLQAFYRQQGFYHARITPKIQKDEEGRVEVEVNIDEGPWVEVTDVDIEIANTFLAVELSTLQDQWPLKPGERFIESNYEELKRLYLNYLLDHGYPRGTVEGKIYLDDVKNTARIRVKVIPGPLSYFGAISVEGEQETPEYIILRKLTFEKGEIFNFEEIYNSQRNLYKLDLFESVALTPEEVPEKERYIPISVKVKEKKKRSIKLGLGYGDEEELRARLALRTRNVGGGGRVLDLESKYSSIESRVEAIFMNPQLWASFFDLAIQGGWIREDLPAYTNRTYYTQSRLERDLPWDFRLHFGHNLLFTRYYDIHPETKELLREPESDELFRISSAILGLRQETTDNSVDPTEGGLLFGEGELASNFLGSNLQFGSTVLEGRRYQGIGGKKFILAARLKLGLIEPIQSTDEIPLYRRFFCGGYNSVRGYRLDYLGPRDSAGNPIGGNALLEGSLEARVPLYKEFRGVVFLDFGNVYPLVEDLDVGQLKYSAGFGLRYSSPIGPVGVDIGFPLNPIDRHKDDYRIHFTIGQAF
ncbi:MAG: BamA/TamA family outer membrane protein [Deltaproteobacteria bacterium]|nr:BamA/TamA family outer membrane protein [Deltaproteobacteria bacterium]MBW1953562.1 BamA/TamA family outer membrane protein [Deltaproteobacteria bacterium]MBW1987705.1 BamA/TamA family outer membrane protein [Deltaproteobacteria bacterium]MBW2135733.1 BamA/TamA family outer membrane protein [Deltaproteobacteria bacterium]